MPEQSDPQREALALRLAREQGARDQKVDGMFDELFRWKKTVNGSIERSANNLRELCDKVDEISERHVRQEEVRLAVERERIKTETERTETLRDAYSKQLDKKTLLIGAAAAAGIPTLVGTLANLLLVHH